MRIESRGYAITELPQDGYISIVPDKGLDCGVRIDITLSDGYVLQFDRAELEQFRIALEHATRIAGQIEDDAS